MTLQFSDTSAEKNGLIQECEFNVFGEGNYGTISGNANLLATFTRNINNAVNRVVSLIMQADQRWEWEDFNNTDLPIASASLVASQQDYALDVSHLKIERVEVKDAAGAWTKLTPIDQADIYSESLTDFLNTAGVPLYYDKLGNSVFLYPKPSYSQTLSLKVYFQRQPSYFLTTDTTKTAGFNPIYHRLVALMASRDYALVKGLSSVKSLSELVIQGEIDIQDSYAMRGKDDHIRLTAKRYSFR